VAVAAPTAFARASVLITGKLWRNPKAIAAVKLSPHPTVSTTRIYRNIEHSEYKEHSNSGK
jgi:hypothetical protein